MTPPRASVAAGDVLAGKYRVERILGKGGMGLVVAAMHLSLDKRVAIKVLLPEVAQSQEVLARFAREARAAGKIESEHVAKVLDVGTLDDGLPYMVMEYLDGLDLAQLVKQRGALPGADAIEYVLQACEALAEAHEAGIVHRDLKPANLFLTHRADGSPCVKVLDFGISKVALAGDRGQRMTQTAALMGSPSYMAPEQLRSARNVDARTDVWSLGIILQELITGEVAFKAETVPELYVSILQAPPTPLRLRRPDAPPAMEAIVARCLEKDPARRFGNVGELATALAPLAPPRAQLSVERIHRIVGRARSGAPADGSRVGAHGTTPMSSSSSPSTGPAGAPYPGPSYASTPPPGPQAFGPAPPYGVSTAQPGPMPFQPPYAAPLAQVYPPAPPSQRGLSPATVVLLILLAAIVLIFGGCATCVCIGAVGASSPAPSAPDTPHASALGRSDAAGAVRRTQPGPFQRPAGWTTVARGARNRPQPDAHPGRSGEALRPLPAPSARRGRASLGERGAGHGRGSGGGNRFAGP